jgi:hypothetical protein
LVSDPRSFAQRVLRAFSNEINPEPAATQLRKQLENIMNATLNKVHWVGVVLAVVVGLTVTGGTALLFEVKGNNNVLRAHEARATPNGKVVAMAKPRADDRKKVNH